MEAPQFPKYLSLTVTHDCGLRCDMCGQWGKHGYLRRPRTDMDRPLTAGDWIRLVEQASPHRPVVLLRGGEPFRLPGIVELIQRIVELGLSLSIDSNGVHLADFADALGKIGGFHITVSVDGPEEIHDRVRGVPGTFRRLSAGIAAVQAAAKAHGTQISLSVNYTISPLSLPGLSALPDVARDLGVSVVCVVPYYSLTPTVGENHAGALKHLGSDGQRWRGFCRESSGIEPTLLLEQLAQYRDRLGELEAYPFLPLTDDEYVAWFQDDVTPVGLTSCHNPQTLLDVQPNGDANFCVDLADFVLGSVKTESLGALWNGERAAQFRRRLERGLLPGCARCGAKYMSRQVPAEPSVGDKT